MIINDAIATFCGDTKLAIGVCHYGVQLLGTFLGTEMCRSCCSTAHEDSLHASSIHHITRNTVYISTEEIVNAGLPAPAVIQLQLSPFNRHSDVVTWAEKLSCAAWSRLSSIDGPVEGWAVVADIAKAKGVTKVRVSCGVECQLCVHLVGHFPKSFNHRFVFRRTQAQILVRGRCKWITCAFPGHRLHPNWNVKQSISREWDPTSAIA